MKILNTEHNSEIVKIINRLYYKSSISLAISNMNFAISDEAIIMGLDENIYSDKKIINDESIKNTALPIVESYYNLYPIVPYEKFKYNDIFSKEVFNIDFIVELITSPDIYCKTLKKYLESLSIINIDDYELLKDSLESKLIDLQEALFYINIELNENEFDTNPYRKVLANRAIELVSLYIQNMKIYIKEISNIIDNSHNYK